MRPATADELAAARALLDAHGHAVVGPSRRWLSTGAAARLLGRSRITVWRWLRLALAEDGCDLPGGGELRAGSVRRTEAGRYQVQAAAVDSLSRSRLV